MEHISAAQLEKYQDILSEIDAECKKHQELEANLEREINKLTSVRIAMEESLAREKMFRVLVKVFASIFEIFYVFGDNIPKTEFECLQKLTACKFYVVEVCVSAAFLQKIVGQKWLLNICIKSDKCCVSKTIGIKRNHPGGPVIVVIPFDASTKEAVVETTLLKEFDTAWSAVNISTTNTDISFHFASQETKVKNPIVKITRSCNAGLDKNLLTVPALEYQFKCKCSVKHFFESIVKNCYHRLNPQIFAAFTNESSSVIAVDFSVDNGHKTTLKLNKREDVLTIVSSIEDLHKLKKYFIGEIQCQSAVADKLWFASLTNMKHYLHGEMYEKQMSPDNLKTFYEGFRKLMFDLAV